MLVMALISAWTCISRLYYMWQTGILAAAVLLAFRLKPWRWRVWARTSRWLSTVSLNRSVCYVGLVGLLAAMTTALAGKTHLPCFHDEFSYLLAGDTFAHGRLTNPTHPMWEFFETFHVTQRPTYMSKYPPGMGLVLAMGEVLAGIPLVGVWITMALASGAAVWMLGAHVPKRWAVLGGLLVAFHPLMGQWAVSFFGGSLATLGGILVIGAVGHISRKPGIVNGILLGVGASLLAMSRPMEGLVLCAVAGVLLLLQMRSAHTTICPSTILKAAVPATLIIAISLAWLGYYNQQVTGDWKTMPYLVCAKQYQVFPAFIFQKPSPVPTYNHPVMAQFYQVNEGVEYQNARSGLWGLVLHVIQQLNTTVGSMLAPAALAAFPLVLLSRPRRGSDVALLAAMGVFAAALCLETWRWSHYGAPAFGLLLTIICRGIRRTGCWRIGQWHAGRALVWGVLAAVVLAAVVERITVVSNSEREVDNSRGKLIADLLATPGKHLVIVRYLAGHTPGDEWVYNGADIDGSTIVFARDMGEARNSRLLEYFSDRQVWLVSVADKEASVEPYGSRRVAP